MAQAVKATDTAAAPAAGSASESKANSPLPEKSSASRAQATATATTKATSTAISPATSNGSSLSTKGAPRSQRHTTSRSQPNSHTLFQPNTNSSSQINPASRSSQAAVARLPASAELKAQSASNFDASPKPSEAAHPRGSSFQEVSAYTMRNAHDAATNDLAGEILAHDLSQFTPKHLTNYSLAAPSSPEVSLSEMVMHDALLAGQPLNTESENTENAALEALPKAAGNEDEGAGKPEEENGVRSEAVSAAEQAGDSELSRADTVTPATAAASLSLAASLDLAAPLNLASPLNLADHLNQASSLNLKESQGEQGSALKNAVPLTSDDPLTSPHEPEPLSNLEDISFAENLEGDSGQEPLIDGSSLTAEAMALASELSLESGSVPLTQHAASSVSLHAAASLPEPQAPSKEAAAAATATATSGANATAATATSRAAASSEVESASVSAPHTAPNIDSEAEELRAIAPSPLKAPGDRPRQKLQGAARDKNGPYVYQIDQEDLRKRQAYLAAQQEAQQVSQAETKRSSTKTVYSSVYDPAYDSAHEAAHEATYEAAPPEAAARINVAFAQENSLPAQRALHGGSMVNVSSGSHELTAQRNGSRKVSSPNNGPLPNVKFWRIAFKVTSTSYDFSAYDQIDLAVADCDLFAEEVFNGNVFYDLCRKNGQYQRYHPDFVQTYYLKLFTNTPFPCSVFVFVEGLALENGLFVRNPHEITMSSTMSKKRRNKNTSLRQITVTPDYEIFYLESPELNCPPRSRTELFLNACSQFMRGSAAQRGSLFLKPQAFCSLSDGRGMEFIKHASFAGIVPNLTSAPTLVPLMLLVGRALACKHSLSHINNILGAALSAKLRRSERLLRRSRRNLKELSFIYYGIEYFLTQSYLVSSISYKNRIAQELYNEISHRLDLNRDYQHIKEQLEPLTHIMQQLSTHEMVRAQGSIRFAIISLGFIMVVVALITCVILGVEPLLRLLHELGIVPPEILR